METVIENLFSPDGGCWDSDAVYDLTLLDLDVMHLCYIISGTNPIPSYTSRFFPFISSWIWIIISCSPHTWQIYSDRTKKLTVALYIVRPQRSQIAALNSSRRGSEICSGKRCFISTSPEYPQITLSVLLGDLRIRWAASGQVWSLSKYQQKYC